MNFTPGFILSRHGGLSGAVRLCLGAVDGRGRGQVHDCDLRAAPVRAAPAAVVRAQGPAKALHRLLDVLPQGGGLTRPRHARHLPRAPVRKGRAVLHDRPRPGRELAHDGRDAPLRGGVLSGALLQCSLSHAQACLVTCGRDRRPHAAARARRRSRYRIAW